jgi:PQQ enzyme repeat
MKISFGFVRGALSACAILAIAAGCGGSQSQTSSLVPGPSNAATAELARLGVGSSIAADAQSSDLLYVSGAKDGSIYVYSYPDGKRQGRLLDVRANALCAGRNGDVFAVAGNEILQYAHGGTRPVAVLHNPVGGTAQFCAVDPATGNLAVSGTSATQSGVAIYAGAKAPPTVYAARNNAGYQSLAYDNDGNLFAGTATGNLVKLTNGGRRFKDVEWSGARLPHLGPIQWDGKYLAVASDATIYRFAVSGSALASAGKTALNGAPNAAQFWIHKGKIAVPDARGVTLYRYPAGGSPLTVIRDARSAQAVTVSRGSRSAFAITTYHYDNLRTGWNNDEYTLTYNNVNSSSFGLLHTLTLDDQVDAQPLLVPNITTRRGAKSGSVHDVVYVATESNTIYAVDASSGTVLFQTNLGAPVPSPLGCNNNGPNVGIDGTPVIDQGAGVMYVIAYTLESNNPTYRIHELNLSDLSEVVPSVIVSASHKLTDGSTYTFQAPYQRQRPGLLEVNGNVYAGFGSFCDFAASVSRGWLLGWQTGSLTPLAANRLNNSLATSPDDFFLSAIWMSGYGVAADPSGNIYFVTGNSDYSGNTYNGVTNVQESVVKVSADLTQLLSIFTPSNVGQLDAYDADLGSGGVVLLPILSSTPLAAAAGKTGTMFLLDQNDLGGFVNGGPNNDLAEVSVGGCWCGPSYFAVKKHQRIVASGGGTVTVWNVKNKPKVRLNFAGSANVPNGQDPGFFTTVSSKKNGRSAIIWALARPQSVPGPMTLVALTAQPPRGSSHLQTLYQASAGYWAAQNGNANVVPVVANGKVYIASYQQLQIFGLGGSAATVQAGHAIAPGAYRNGMKTPNEVTGTLVTVSGSQLTLRTRTGKLVRVDASTALKNERVEDLVVGRPFNVRGTYDAAGVMHAAAIVRAKPSSSTWPPDR